MVFALVRMVGSELQHGERGSMVLPMSMVLPANSEILTLAVGPGSY